MNDQEKSREQLIAELVELRQRVANQDAQLARSQQAEADQRTINSRLPVLVATAGFDGYYKEVNAAFERILGWSEQESLSRPFLEFIHPEDRAAAVATFARLKSGDSAINFLDRNLCQDGSHRWISWIVIPVPGRNVVFGIGQDITEKKQAEDELRRSEARWRSMVDNAPVQVTTVDDAGTILFINRPVPGLTLENVVGRSVYEFLESEYRDQARQCIEQVFHTGATVVNESMVTGPHGTRSWYETRLGPVKVAEQVVAATLISSDITERKQAEATLQKARDELGRRVEERTAELTKANRQFQSEVEARKRIEAALRQSEERYELAVRGAGAGIWDWDLCTGKVYYSPRWKMLFGYEENEIGDGFDDWASRLHPDERESIIKRQADFLAGTSLTATAEYRLRNRDGSYRWIIAHVLVVRDAEGKALRLVGSHGDIGDRKLAEEALRQSEAKYRALVESSPDAVAMVDLQGRIVFASERAAQQHGALHPDELIGLQAANLVAEGDRERFMANDRRLIEEGTRRNDRYTGIRRDGTTFDAEVSSAVMRDAAGNPQALMGVYRDITERTQAETAVLESRNSLERERALLQAVMDGAKNVHLVYLDRDFNFVRVNEAYAKTCGYAPAEMIGKNHFVLYPDAENEAIFVRVRDTGVPAEFHDKPFVFPDQPERGTTYWDWTLSPVREATGKVVGLVFSLVETTERKQAEAELRASKEQFELVVRGAGVGIWDWDIVSGRLYYSPRWRQLFGYAESEMGDRLEDWARLLHPDERERIVKFLEDFLAGTSSTVTVEYRLRHKDGSYRWIEAHGLAVRDEQGKACRLVGSHGDITDRKWAEAALRDSEERLRFALEVSQTGAWDLDLFDHTLHRSLQHDRIFGYQSLLPSWTYEMFLEQVLPEDRAAVDHQFRQAVDTHSDWSFECRIRRSDGQIRWIWAAGRHRLDQSGCPRRVAGIIQDVTDRRNAEEATLQAIPDLLFEVDREGRILRHHSPDYERLYVPPRELLGRTIGEVLPRDAANVILTALVEADRKGWQRGATYSVDLPDGPHWFELSIAAKPDTLAVARRFILLARDITKRKRAEDALRESEERFRVALATAPVAVFHQDQELRYTWIVDPVLGITGDAAIGRTDEELFGAEMAAPLTAIKRRVLESGRGERQPVSAARGGPARYFDMMVEPLRSSVGQVIGVTCAAYDITEQRRAALVLATAKEAAEAANQTKSQFLANISHELRTPMTAVLGMLALALQDKLSPALREHLQLAKNAADVQLELLNEILDFSRIEAGKIVLEAAAFNLRIALDQAIKVLGVKAYEKRLELYCAIPRQVPIHLIGDPFRLRQILTNLMGNAIKFTETGEVTLRVAVESQTAQDVLLRFSVTDTGIGISRENRAKIFSPFSQVDASTTRRYGGAGLGLSIASTLVELMGGRLDVDSTPGRGSTFAFTAQFRRQSGESETSPLEQAFLPRLRDLPVLVVDGHATSRQIVCDMLTEWSLQPATAASIPEALAAAEQREAAKRPFRLMIIDAGLLAAEGQAVDEHLRRQRPSRLATILMLPYGGYHALKKLRHFGKSKVLVEKPVCQTDLFLAMLRSLKIAPPVGQKASMASAPTPAARSLRILVADDTGSSRTYISEVLQERGHAVQTAANGREAFELVRDQDFDVVLMDVQMPEMDGDQATAAVRALPQLAKSRLPIVALTAHARRENERECLAAGMNAYLSKPVRAAALIEMVERLAD